MHLLYVLKVNRRPKLVFHNIHTHMHKAKACGTHLRLTFYTNHLKTLRAFLFNAAHYLLLAVENVIAVSVTHFQMEHSGG